MYQQNSKMKFSELPIGSSFIWTDRLYIKISESLTLPNALEGDKRSGLFRVVKFGVNTQLEYYNSPTDLLDYLDPPIVPLSKKTKS